MEDEDDVQSQSLSLSRSPTPPPHPISVVPPSAAAGAPNGRLSSPAVTVAAPPHQTLTLALPIQHPRLPSSSNPSGGGGGGREDCWSEGATSNLIDAWGERYLELSRGNLKQKHWQEVADAVSSRDDYTKPPKTDVQCKNRIDTLKKKYKLEKSKIASGATSSSSWPFFHRLDLLIGPNQKPANPNNPNNNPPPSKGPTFNPIRPQFPQKLRTSHPSSKKRSRSRSPSSASSKSEEAASADSSDSFPPETAANGRKRVEPAAGVKELTRAIIRFGEVYERVESSKLQQAMEMEKQRMGFARELELQRMQFFMKTQMELSQLKRHHQGSGRRRRRRSAAADGGGGSSNNHHHHHHREDINSNNSNNTE